jgi:hypothetical protein
MCYEVFNRSAAQAYLQAIRREKRERDEGRGAPEESAGATITSQRVVHQKESILSQIDWVALQQKGRELFKKYWKWLVVGVTVVTAWALLDLLFSASLWYDLLGKKFRYAYSDPKGMQYLVGIKQNVKVWSERQGRLDTPMETRFTDEMGNVLFERNTDKKNPAVRVKVREWIQILKDDIGSASRGIPLNHPTLAGGKILLGKNGEIQERHHSNSSRLGKSLVFLTPRFPKGSLKQGKTWTENIEWVDDFGGWTIRWSGVLRSQLGELKPCHPSMCAEIRTIADIKAQLKGAPEWARGSTSGAQGQASGRGTIQFDASNKRLAGHNFSYQGQVLIPVRSLEIIPMELRVGRRVRGPGVIVINLDNSISIQKN